MWVDIPLRQICQEQSDNAILMQGDNLLIERERENYLSASSSTSLPLSL